GGGGGVDDGEVVLHRRLVGLSVDGVDSDHTGLELLECGAGDLVPRVRVGDAHADQLREGGDVALAPVLDAVDAVGGRGVDGAEGLGDQLLGHLACWPVERLPAASAGNWTPVAGVAVAPVPVSRALVWLVRVMGAPGVGCGDTRITSCLAPGRAPERAESH